MRPKAIHDARAAHAKGELSSSDLRSIEDAEIAKHVKELLQHGVRDITDGEFRREYFHLDFLKHLQGVTISKNTLEQKEGRVPPTLSITEKLSRPNAIEVANFEYLKSLVPP